MKKEYDKNVNDKLEVEQPRTLIKGGAETVFNLKSSQEEVMKICSSKLRRYYGLSGAILLTL